MFRCQNAKQPSSSSSSISRFFVKLLQADPTRWLRWWLPCRARALCHKLRCLKIGHNRYSCIRHATPTASYLQQKNIRLGNKYFVKVQVPVPKMHLSTAQVPVPVPSTTRLGQTDRRTPADSYYRAYKHGQRPQGRIIKRPIRIALRSKNLWCRVCSEGKPAAVYYIGYIISLHTAPSSVARFIRYDRVTRSRNTSVDRLQRNWWKYIDMFSLDNIRMLFTLHSQLERSADSSCVRERWEDSGRRVRSAHLFRWLTCV